MLRIRTIFKNMNNKICGIKIPICVNKYVMSCLYQH